MVVQRRDGPRWLRELDDDDDDDDVNSSIENYVFVIPVGELQCCGHAFTHTRRPSSLAAFRSLVK